VVARAEKWGSRWVWNVTCGGIIDSCEEEGLQSHQSPPRGKTSSIRHRFQRP